MSRTILAAVARAPGTPFTIDQLELDAPRADEVLVRIHGVGLCHTDLAAREQHLPIALPAVLGHEGGGIVEAVGEAVTGVKPGDHVVLTFRSCGACSSCTKGEPAYCLHFNPLNGAGCRTDGSDTLHDDNGKISGCFFGQSSFADYALAYERNVVKAPDDVPIEILGPLGCGVQTGAGSVMRSLACRAGSSLLILGGGAVGLSAVMGAVVQGCATIIVSEPHASRRELALSLGATHVLGAAEDLAQAVRAIVPDGVDYAFDTTGRSDALGAALAALGHRGQLAFVGVPANPTATFDVSILGVMSKGQTIRGVIEGDSDPQSFIPQLIDLYREGRFPVDRLVRTYPFASINEAIEDQRTGACVKAVLLTSAGAAASNSIALSRKVTAAAFG